MVAVGAVGIVVAVEIAGAVGEGASVRPELQPTDKTTHSASIRPRAGSLAALTFIFTDSGPKRNPFPQGV